MTDEAFGQFIKKLRETKEWTLREAAEKIGGVNFAYLSQLEAGVAKPSEYLARRIAKAYGADEENLVFQAREIPKQIDEIIQKFPNASAAYFRKTKRPKQ